MKLLYCLIMFPVLICAQAGGKVTPDTPVATVDGRRVTAGELQSILRGLPAAAQQQAMRSPSQFLEQYGLLRRLSSLAEKEGLEKQSPWKDQIEYNRMVALAQAQLAKVSNETKATQEEIQKHYEGNKERYDQVKVKAIYIPFSATPPANPDPKAPKVLAEAEAKAKAEKILAEIRGGADFVKMVKEHSGDPTSAANNGDFGAIRRSDRLPDPIKTAIFALKAGELSEPIRQPNGFYLFRVEEKSIEPLDQVKSRISEELKQTKMNEWMNGTRKSIEVKIENEAFFTRAGAPGAPAAPAAPPAASSPAPVK